MAKSKGANWEPIPSILFGCKCKVFADAITAHLTERKTEKGISRSEQQSIDRVIQEMTRASEQAEATMAQSSAIVVTFLLGPKKKGAKK